MTICIAGHLSPEYEVFIEYYSQIISSLSVETISPYFVSQNIITQAEQLEILSFSSKIKSASLLLCNIASALNAGITENFYKFLDITEQHGHIGSKAVTTDIRKRLSELRSKCIVKGTVLASYTHSYVHVMKLRYLAYANRHEKTSLIYT